MNDAITAHIAELRGPRDLHFRGETLRPDDLGPDDILARTLVSVLSPGTELAAWRGDPPLRPMKVYPRVVGYCNVAEVLAVGDAVEKVRPGDRILSWQSHRSAFRMPVSGIAFVLDPEEDAERIATTYLFHLGYNALLKGGFVPGMSVAVIGLGTLGFGAASLAAASGGRVMGLSDAPYFREEALAAGVHRAVEKRAEAARAAAGELLGAPEVDLVVTTTNGWEDWRLALELARREGTVAVLGFPGRGQEDPPFNPLDSRWFYDKQLRLVACGFSPNVEAPAHDLRFTQARNMEYLRRRIRQGGLPADILISGRRSWRELARAYETLDAREEPLFTISLDWEGAHA